MKKRLLIKLCITFLLILLTAATTHSLSGRTVKGRILQSDNSTAAEDAVVVVKTYLVAFDCNCTTGVGAHSYTDSNGDYSILSNNLVFDGDCAGTGNLNGDACDGTQTNNDYLWIEVDGSNVVPPQGNHTSPYSASYTWASLYDASEFADVINGTLGLGPNEAPVLTSVNASPSLVKGGNTVTITPTGQSDSDNDTLTLVCCIDTADSCTPTLATNNCTGGNYYNQSYPYSTLSCTFAAPSADDTYYTRCLLHDGRDYSTAERSTSFDADGTAPTTSDDYAYDGVWNNQNASITITENCDIAGCNFTRYCTDSDNTCTPNTNITGGGIVNITSEGTTFLRYFSQDLVGNVQSVQSVNVSLDFTLPTITDDYTLDDVWTNESQTITLTPNDALSGVSTVKYCSGASCDPSTGSTLGSPYQLTYNTEQNNITIRYLATDVAGNPSAIGSFILKIDLSAPTTSDNFTMNDTWIKYNANILITPNCDIADCNFTKYCTDTTNTCTPNVSIGAPTAVQITDENITYLRYHSQDNAGNVQGIQYKTIKIDKTEPSSVGATLTIDNGATYSTDSTLDLAWSGFTDTLSGIDHYYANFTDSSGTTSGVQLASSPGSIGNAPEGTTSVFIWAQDIAGNIGSTTANDSIIVDLTDPTSISIYNVTEDSGTDYLFYNASATTLYYSNVGNSQFTIYVDAEDAVSGLANATGETAFSDSPVDTTEEGNPNYEYTLTYTIEVPSAYSQPLTITVYDLAGRSDTADLTVTRDITAPTVTLDDGYNGWNPDDTPTFSWNASDTESGLQKYVWNIDNSGNQTISDITNTSFTLSSQSDGNHTFYLYTYDHVGNIDKTTHDFAVDSTLPSTPATITDPDDYDTNGIFTISWSTVTDTSGVTYTLYESTNGGSSWSVEDSGLTANSSTLSGKQNNVNYTYKVAARNGAGLYSSNTSSTDGILVDLEEPTFSNFQNSAVTSNSSDVLEVNVTVTEDESGLNATPQIRYKYGAESFSSYTVMTLVTGSIYTYDIPVPPGGWVNFTGQNVSWQFYAADKAGNQNTSDVQTAVITSINSITFNVQDRILQQNLTDVTLTGGTSCPTGCTFNYTKTIYEENGQYQFNISKSGFSTNTTTLQVNSQNYEINVSLDDTQNPAVVFLNFTPTNVSGENFYISVFATITDNFNLSAKSLNYTLSNGVTDSGTISFTVVSGDTYQATLGPYNTTVLMESNITAIDLYSNTNLTELDKVWFVPTEGEVNMTYPPVLDPIGTQILTVGQPYSHTVTASDPNNDPLTFSDNATFFDINETTGVISFTPNESLAGTHIVNISVSDGLLIDYELVTFRIGNNVLELYLGWNLVSTPEVENTSIRDIFYELSNGNWGCGRGGDPLLCNESDGDFAGNFSKIMGYNVTSSTFIVFNPTDYYLAIDNQTLQNIDPKQGYWINMTAAQNISLVVT